MGDNPDSERIKLIAKRKQPDGQRVVRLNSKELPDAVPVAGGMAQDLTICEAVWRPQKDRPDIGSDALLQQCIGQPSRGIMQGHGRACHGASFEK